MRQVIQHVDFRPSDLPSTPEQLRALPHNQRPVCAIFTHSLERNGANNFCLYIARLLRHNQPLTIFSPKKGPMQEDFEKLGLEVTIMDTTSPKFLEDLSSALLKRRVGLLLANTIMRCDIILMAAELQMPSVWVIHESWPQDQLDHHSKEVFMCKDIDAAVIRKAFAAAGTIVFPSDMQRDLYNGMFKPQAGLTIYNERNSASAIGRLQTYPGPSSSSSSLGLHRSGFSGFASGHSVQPEGTSLFGQGLCKADHWKQMHQSQAADRGCSVHSRTWDQVHRSNLWRSCILWPLVPPLGGTFWGWGWEAWHHHHGHSGSCPEILHGSRCGAGSFPQWGTTPGDLWIHGFRTPSGLQQYWCHSGGPQWRCGRILGATWECWCHPWCSAAAVPEPGAQETDGSSWTGSSPEAVQLRTHGWVLSWTLGHSACSWTKTAGWSAERKDSAGRHGQHHRGLGRRIHSPLLRSQWARSLGGGEVGSEPGEVWNRGELSGVRTGPGDGSHRLPRILRELGTSSRCCRGIAQDGGRRCWCQAGDCTTSFVRRQLCQGEVHFRGTPTWPGVLGEAQGWNFQTMTTIVKLGLAVSKSVFCWLAIGQRSWCPLPCLLLISSCLLFWFFFVHPIWKLNAFTCFVAFSLGERFLEVGACCVQLVFWKTWFGTSRFYLRSCRFGSSLMCQFHWELDCVGFPLLKFGDVVVLKWWRGLAARGSCFPFRVSPGYRQSIAGNAAWVVLPCLVLPCLALSCLVLSCRCCCCRCRCRRCCFWSCWSCCCCCCCCLPSHYRAACATRGCTCIFGWPHHFDCSRGETCVPLCFFPNIIQNNLKQWPHRCSVHNMIPNFRAIKNAEH